MVKTVYVVPEIPSQTDRQTHTDVLITILSQPLLWAKYILTTDTVQNKHIMPMDTHSLKNSYNINICMVVIKHLL